MLAGLVFCEMLSQYTQSAFQGSPRVAGGGGAAAAVCDPNPPRPFARSRGMPEFFDNIKAGEVTLKSIHSVVFDFGRTSLSGGLWGEDLSYVSSGDENYQNPPVRVHKCILQKVPCKFLCIYFCAKQRVAS